MTRIVRCVGAVVVDDDGRLLLIQRAHEPGRGLWSLPGGRIEPGETDGAALARELVEETGLAVAVGPLLGRVERPAGAGVVYDIADYSCRVVAGEARAGSDAAALAWVADVWPPHAAGQLTEGLAEVLASWGVAAALRGHDLQGQELRSQSLRGRELRGQDSTGTGRPGCSPPRASP